MFEFGILMWNGRLVNIQALTEVGASTELSFEKGTLDKRHCSAEFITVLLLLMHKKQVMVPWAVPNELPFHRSLESNLGVLQIMSFNSPLCVCPYLLLKVRKLMFRELSQSRH